MTQPGKPPHCGLWIYPWDVLDEGSDTVLDRARHRAGATAVHVAAAYHSGRFLLPHNPSRRVHHATGTALYFRPSSAEGIVEVAPPVWQHAGDPGLWPALRAGTRRRDLELGAWMTPLHNTPVGLANPDLVVVNAHGDRMWSALCPANPTVRAYAAALAVDAVDQLHVDRVVFEGLHYPRFRHGFHHELVGVEVDELAELLLSLCMCRWCLRAGAAVDLDVERLVSRVRAEVDRRLRTPAPRPNVDAEDLSQLFDGDLAVFLRARNELVTTLVDEVSASARAASPVSVGVCDLGAVTPRDWAAATSGVDLVAQAHLVDELHPVHNTIDRDVHAARAAAYASELADAEVAVLPSVRAIAPFTTSADDLEEQVRPFVGRVPGLSFYNYGLMSLDALGWVGEVMGATFATPADGRG